MPERSVDPATIKPGQRAKFQCPECSFAFWYYWTSSDACGGDSHCYLHGDERVTMFISTVEPIPPNL